MLIELKGMAFYANHGCYSEEKITGNRFEVDLRLRTNDTLAATTDNIHDALNYQDAYNIVAEQMAITANLLENVAERILSALFAHYTRLEWAAVTVAKLNPAMGGLINRVQVTIEQDRATNSKLNAQEENASLQAFIATMHQIRKKCPWNAKQTFASLVQYTIEEVYELAEAITNNNDAEIKKELGDLLMHVLFYAIIAEEEGRFSLSDIAEIENQKMIYRHPHVFKNNEHLSPEEVEAQWEALKLKEHDGNRTLFAGLPNSLPPFTKTQRIAEKADASGFDMGSKHDVWGKVMEEYNELQEALQEHNPAHIQEEYGDLLFTLIHAAHQIHVDPALALEMANRKFIARFNIVEQAVQALNRDFHSMSFEEMLSLWQTAKEQVRAQEQQNAEHDV